MSRVMAVANQKGGVGKSTSTVQVAGYLGAVGKKVLLVDIDPQGNATQAMGKGLKDFDAGMVDLFASPDLQLQEAIIPAWENVDLIPCDIRLSTLEVQQALEGKPIPLTLLRDKLRPTLSRYDYIMIDTPPSLGAFTINAFSVAQRVLIPIDGANPFALVGFKLLSNTLRDVQRQFNPELKPLGFFRAKWDGRPTLSKDIWARLVSEYPHLAFDTFIPENVRLPQAMAVGDHILRYDDRASGAHAYQALTAEILDRWDGARW